VAYPSRYSHRRSRLVLLTPTVSRCMTRDWSTLLLGVTWRASPRASRASRAIPSSGRKSTAPKSFLTSHPAASALMPTVSSAHGPHPISCLQVWQCDSVGPSNRLKFSSVGACEANCKTQWIAEIGPVDFVRLLIPTMLALARSCLCRGECGTFPRAARSWAMLPAVRGTRRVCD
jgi:hypothetical protein